MMEDGNGRKKVWICLSIVVLAAVVIGAGLFFLKGW